MFMTSEAYLAAFEKACLVRHEPLNVPSVRAFFDAHHLHVKHVQHHVNLLKQQPSEQTKAILLSYKQQQDMCHMKTAESVEEYYRTALSQPGVSFQVYAFTSVALESRQIQFEIQKELRLATEKQRVLTSRAPLRIVSLLFEGTSIQAQLKMLIKTMVFQNPVQFVGLSEEHFLLKICSVPWITQISASDKVISLLIVPF